MTEPTPTNLTDKFDALKALMTTQHTALVANHTALMAKIDALMGVGPENTLKSVNQSIWNLAGTAPGATLLELKTAIEAISSGKSISDIFTQWDSGSAYTLLNNIYTALSSSGLTQTQSKDILTRIIYQFDSSVVSPTMKDLMRNMDTNIATIADNTNSPMTPPSDMCATPFTNSGIEYVSVSMNFTEPFTLATWPTTVPSEYSSITTESGGLAVGQTIVRCADWSQYRIYVASSATTFAAQSTSLQRFPTNQWITLSGNYGFEFSVTGPENFTVYICGSGGAPPNPNQLQNADPGTCGSGEYNQRIVAYSIMGTFSSGGVDYTAYNIVIPDVPGLLIQIGAHGIVQCDPAWKAAHTNGWINLCVSWDFTGNIVYPTWGRLAANNSAAVDNYWVDWQSINVGSYGTEMRTGTSTEYVSYSFAAPTEYGMPSNVFISVTGYFGI